MLYNGTMRLSLLIAGIALSGASGTSSAQQWRYWGGDAGGTKYSTLDQVNKSNVRQLKPVWILDTGDFSDGKVLPGRSAFETTPLVVDGIMYVSTSFHRLLALDPETGRVLWQFDPRFDRSTRVMLFQSRGVAFWQKGSDKRILMGDQQGRLFSVNATTGKLDPGFGTEGVVELRKGMADKFPKGAYGLTSPPAVCGNTVITGSWVSDAEPLGPSGDVRGFDVRSGRELWRFHTVPHEGEFGNETWGGSSWKDRGGTNVWSNMSVDERRGMVFLPLTSPSTDYYGGDRPGANLFGDSVVALDCKTGQRRWHFQTVHHNLWDYDLPSQPVLVTVRHDGNPVDAVAQATKTGFVFLLNRDTGKPLFDVAEQAVPRSPIPGEQSWPTQPIPVKPPPFARQSMRLDELTDVTPESRAECLAMIKDAVVEGHIFDPITDKPTVMFPGTNGGSNWGGGSFDPTTATLFVSSMDVAAFMRIVQRPPGSEIPYRSQGFGRFWDSKNYPCQKPPWGTLTAIDLNSGEFRWQVRLGEFDELKARGVPKTGTPNLGGSIVTAGGLVFIGATNDSKFRAFDKDTGEELWMTKVPASAHATPMTFLGPRSGRQFIMIAAGGGNKYNETFSGKLLAFALPQPGDPREPAMILATRGPSRSDYVAREEKLPIAVAAQPLPFSHRVHSSAGLKCMGCHAGAVTEARAGLPVASQCVSCHPTMTAPVTWVHVYTVPDYVSFNHSRHSRANIGCVECHGPVQTRDVLKREVSTSMAACLNCHRAKQAPVSCNVCHNLGQ